MSQLVEKEEKLRKKKKKTGTQDYLNTLLNTKKDKFITNLISMVSQNPNLTECTNLSLMSGAIVATALNLSLNKSFGYAYLVPFKRKVKEVVNGRDVWNEVVEAQFQIGYKGYVQLALRTNAYHRINSVPIYKSQFQSWNAMTEDLKINSFDNFDGDEIAGYVAFFRLNNGFEKTMYWSYDKMLRHADMYSMAFNAQKYEDLKNNKIPQNELWKYSSFWYKSFDEMAIKTMLRQVLSKYGIMSEDMQKAYETDQAVMQNDTPIYVDNDQTNAPRANEAVEQDEVVEQDDPFKTPEKIDINDL